VLTSDRNFWWVNHKRTAREEIAGSFIWAPKLDKRGRRREVWDNLTRCERGDLVFSYSGRPITFVGVVTGPVQQRDRPVEGDWSGDGWLVPVDWTKTSKTFLPKDYADILNPLRPNKNSPVKADGTGNQNVYLAEIDVKMALSCLELLGESAPEPLGSSEMEERDLDEVRSNPNLGPTERAQLSMARRGQGRFRRDVAAIETSCRVTGISNQGFLRASHIKPWRSSSDQERLTGHNGLLLAPHIDLLFDQGWISFGDDGAILVAPSLDQGVSSRWIDPNRKTDSRPFNAVQQEFLAYHRREIFRI
jgi:putative restriction endonuclease